MSRDPLERGAGVVLEKMTRGEFSTEGTRARRCDVRERTACTEVIHRGDVNITQTKSKSITSAKSGERQRTTQGRNPKPRNDPTERASRS